MELQISSLALYHFSHPGSNDATSLNLSLESNDMQDVVVCDTICHNLINELISYLFTLIFKIKLISKYKPIVCGLKNYNLNSGEKFGSGSSFSLEFKL